MRRLVLQLDDRPEIQGEIGLDNDGNIYLRGADGQGIRLLQDTSNIGDYVPELSNYYNIDALTLHSAGYVVLGKQCLVTLLYTKDSQDVDNQSEFEVTLPFPPVFTEGNDEGADRMFGANNTLPIAATSTVKIQHFASPSSAGPHVFQTGFCYRIP